MRIRWTDAKEQRLSGLVKSGKYTYPEIAKIMRLSRNQVFVRAQQMGLTNPTYKIRITKHKHLREPVMRYFQTHSMEQTAKHFGLPLNQVRSIFTICYREPEFKHLRKDKRTHRPWTKDDWKFLAAHAGLMPRIWIAKKLKRTHKGKFHVVKERLATAGVGSRYLNGLTATLAHGLLPDVAFVSILTRAGSPGCGGNTQARVVPWVALEDLTRGRHIDPVIRDGIRAMARFQRWVHGTKTNGQTMDAITHILGGRNAHRITEETR